MANLKGLLLPRMALTEATRLALIAYYREEAELLAQIAALDGPPRRASLCSIIVAAATERGRLSMVCR